ncbi:MAG: hypothetical protein PHE86_05130 [Candidatus Marinimicrobia bacterium]|nr:hypothetical protein [Candidatus Neomarinimicrobiota bacterium]MDD5582124.1 hypothetical protein [Candidatus Neomarinimicrobiota bacterium]
MPNNKPWHYIFVTDEEQLENLYPVYSKGNEWAQQVSMVIAIIAKQEDDCVIGSRFYYHFDTRISVSQLLLQATELR